MVDSHSQKNDIIEYNSSLLNPLKLEESRKEKETTNTFLAPLDYFQPDDPSPLIESFYCPKTYKYQDTAKT